jgi:hypothetical protein
LQTSEFPATIAQDRDVPGSCFSAPGKSFGVDDTQNIDTITSTPSTRLTSPDNASAGWLGTPATSPSTKTSPPSSVIGSFTQCEGSSFTCCHCQKVFHRRCDLK